jgi:hypothetical protein
MKVKKTFIPQIMNVLCASYHELDAKCSSSGIGVAVKRIPTKQ